MTNYTETGAQLPPRTNTPATQVSMRFKDTGTYQLMDASLVFVPASVPTLSAKGLMALATLLIVTGAWLLRRMRA